MPYQSALIERAVTKSGVPSSFVGGWGTRGNLSFNPRGLVVHHDAASIRSGNNGALNIIIHGRQGLPGPLSQFQIARNGLLWVVAAGRANHAGSGSFRGLSGNSSVFGIEAANNGLGEPWGDKQLDTYYKISKALMDELGRDVSWLCAHREWTPRKPDPRFSTPSMTMNQFRSLVQRNAPVVIIDQRALTERAESMYKFYQAQGSSQVWAVSGGGYGFHLTPELFKEMQDGPALLSNTVHRVSPGQLSQLTSGRFNS